MYKIVVALLFSSLCSLSTVAQEVFSNATAIQDYPLVKGYSKNATDTAFHNAVDAYLRDYLEDEFEETDLVLAGDCDLILTIHHNLVKEVNVVDFNSVFFARTVEVALQQMPIEGNTHTSPLYISHALQQPLGCCDKGRYNVEPLSESEAASKALSLYYAKHMMYQPDSLRWLVRTDENGLVNCIINTPFSAADWNDEFLLAAATGLLEDNLPDQAGHWIVGYYPKFIEYDQVPFIISYLKNTDPKKMGEWNTALNTWRSFVDCPAYFPIVPSIDSIEIPLNRATYKVDTSIGARHVWIVEPLRNEVLFEVEIHGMHTVRKSVTPGTIYRGPNNDPCGIKDDLAPIIVEVVYIKPPHEADPNSRD